MEARGLVVEHGRRLPSGQVQLKLSPDHPIPPEVLGTTEMAGVMVGVAMPAHLNLIKGIIFHPELALMDQDVVLEMLQEHHVVAVRKPPEAAYAVLSWARSASAELPATVLVGWDRVRVRPCKVRPRRCYCCQQYGHVAAVCTKTPVCSRCAGEHDPEDCQRPYKCAVCGGPHAATDSECGAWVEEKAVAKIRNEKKLSYSAALKQRQEDRRTEERRPTVQERRPQEAPQKKEEKKNEELQKREDPQKRKHDEKTTEEEQDSTTDEEVDVEGEDNFPVRALPTSTRQWEPVVSKRRRKKRRRQRKTDSEESDIEQVCTLRMTPFIDVFSLNL